MSTEAVERVEAEELAARLKAEAERHQVAAERTEGFFGYVFHAINQVNARFRYGLPISYGYRVLERKIWEEKDGRLTRLER